VVDLKALTANLGLLRRAVGKGVGVIGIVKAGAYGHGAPRVARTLAGLGVKSFGVATLEEAAELRASGLRNEILLLGPLNPRWLAEAARLPLGVTGWSSAYLDLADEAAKKTRRPLDVHLKVDTGMSRLGFAPSEIPAVLRDFRSRRWPHLRLSSAYTHLACADQALDRSTPVQFREFRDLPWPGGLRLHASNSAASLRYPKPGFTAVRPGIFLYGALEGAFHPALKKQQPVLSLVTQVVAVRTVPKGRGVSYGSTFVASRPTRVATLAIGYADGVPRFLSNRGRVLIGGRSCRILGRVCMDLCMVDVTPLRSVAPGSEAMLLGRQDAKEIKVSEWAKLGGTITYEMLCGISSRVPREYVG
jgi:alanine racemase